jgi:hypothetical protein
MLGNTSQQGGTSSSGSVNQKSQLDAKLTELQGQKHKLGAQIQSTTIDIANDKKRPNYNALGRSEQIMQASLNKCSHEYQKLLKNIHKAELERLGAEKSWLEGQIAILGHKVSKKPSTSAHRTNIAESGRTAQLQEQKATLAKHREQLNAVNVEIARVKSQGD